MFEEMLHKAIPKYIKPRTYARQRGYNMARNFQRWQPQQQNDYALKFGREISEQLRSNLEESKQLERQRVQQNIIELQQYVERYERKLKDPSTTMEKAKEYNRRLLEKQQQIGILERQADRLGIFIGKIQTDKFPDTRLIEAMSQRIHNVQKPSKLSQQSMEKSKQNKDQSYKNAIDRSEKALQLSRETQSQFSDRRHSSPFETLQKESERRSVSNISNPDSVMKKSERTLKESQRLRETIGESGLTIPEDDEEESKSQYSSKHKQPTRGLTFLSHYSKNQEPFEYFTPDVREDIPHKLSVISREDKPPDIQLEYIYPSYLGKEMTNPEQYIEDLLKTQYEQPVQQNQIGLILNVQPHRQSSTSPWTESQQEEKASIQQQPKQQEKASIQQQPKQEEKEFKIRQPWKHPLFGTHDYPSLKLVNFAERYNDQLKSITERYDKYSNPMTLNKYWEKKDAGEDIPEHIQQYKNNNLKIQDEFNQIIQQGVKEGLKIKKDFAAAVGLKIDAYDESKREFEEGYHPGFGRRHDAQHDGTYLSEAIRMISTLIPKIDKYDVNVITNNNQRIQFGDRPGVIIIFLKQHHYTVAVYRKDRNEIAYFDSLAEKERRKEDFGQLQDFSQRISPELTIKYKFNILPWQEAGLNKGDSAWCWFYSFIFLHNYINLDEDFKDATEYTKEDKKMMQELIPTKQKFPFI